MTGLSAAIRGCKKPSKHTNWCFPVEIRSPRAQNKTRSTPELLDPVSELQALHPEEHGMLVGSTRRHSSLSSNTLDALA